MVSADRQTIMEVNRSLRNIKTELENLLEKGVIDENVFDTIHASLPPESSVSGPLRTTSNTNGASANTSPAARDNGPTYTPPTQGLQTAHLGNSTSPVPPSYNDTPAPGVPPRGGSGKPTLTTARALYRYGATDARDLTFEKDDIIAVYEYMNQDWWMGMNQRTGQEGIFPRSYVLPEQDNKAPGGYGPPQPQYGYPAGPPQQQNPYNANVPPMAVAEGGQAEGGAGGGKAGELGKKFGKKLGNAAIFGAGATIGGNIVNSIF
ncbi:SH3 domain protein [Cordyceps militaris CM01]|uniref:SH3 domain protein n=1 Tax=Cordyceps militaris (strain CM01) TaxID=983644 RepID=G3J613_CORMM|nr:SH3 domain protein [Cordyceps militaris CM01]EGX96117.1 SH3 domain protein [Cordyceps militaris CM01]